MKALIKIEKEVNITHLKVKAGVRYWEDATINNVEDTNGDLIPLRNGDYWCPIIDIENGIIKDWPQGVEANIHYKVCDDGEYWLITNDGYELKYPGYYVPNILDLYKESFGDYIILKVDKNGLVSDWNNSPNINDFLEEE